MKVIFDCDNTMGIKGCDVNGGLALLYLLGRENIELCGITTSYGNSNIDTVYNNTANMLKEIGRTDIHILKGCPNRYTHESEAADYILETVNANPGKISILTTGSLTNLFSAYIKDQTIFEKIPQIVVSGGVTEELNINGKVLDELSLSNDPSATQWVLKEGKNLSIITGNNCLNAFIDHSNFVHRCSLSTNPLACYIMNKCEYWFDDMRSCYNVNGFYNWDVFAAAYLANPKLFIDDYQFISLNHRAIESGLLCIISEKEEAACTVNLPMIKGLQAFNDDIYGAWFGVKSNSMN